MFMSMFLHVSSFKICSNVQNVKNGFGDQLLAGAGGQALEEAEKIKKERGDNFELVWQLGYG